MRLNTRFWREWHRWVAFPAALFLFYAGTTGVVVAVTEKFGEAERLREATRDVVSPLRTASDETEWAVPLRRALDTARGEFPDAPIDKIEMQFKGDAPTVTLFTGKPEGGEDRKLVFDLASGALVANETYADKPFLYRLHSGELYGDGGLVVAMIWGAALVWLSVSGLIIYLRMRRASRTGLKRVFW